MKRFFFLLFLLLPLSQLSAQDTFSMVAVDTLTGEVGASGASCVSFLPLGSLINRLVPGVGALTCQASLNTLNRDYALSMMQRGLTSQEIIDSLYTYDFNSSPEEKQNMAVTLLHGGAAYTGTNCTPYANQIVGPNYVIAGNILAGQQILDSMETRFLAEPGDLAHKLMAALQGANVVGADTRCNQYNTSSLAAYLRVAQPGDSVEDYSLDIFATTNPMGPIFEPIDSLQILFDELFPLNRQDLVPSPQIEIYPQPANEYVILESSGTGLAHLKNLELCDSKGRVLVVATKLMGPDKVRLELHNMPAGVYFLHLTGPHGHTMVKRILKK